jgi:hypothetical protein
VRPVETVARQQPNVAAVEPGVHTEAVIFDFMQPLVALRRRFDELGQLRADPLRQSGRIAARPPR